MFIFMHIIKYLLFIILKYSILHVISNSNFSILDLF